MVRHSGFYSFLLAIVFATLAVSILERRSDGSLPLRMKRVFVVDRSSPLVNEGRLDRFPEPRCRTGTADGSESCAVQFRVPANSLTIVGSLDVSGALHSLVIESDVSSEFCRQTEPDPFEAGDVAYIDENVLTEVLAGLYPPSEFIPRERVNLQREIDSPVTFRIPEEASARRFLIPHFESDQIIQQPAEAVPVTEGDRVRVYLDSSLLSDGRHGNQRGHLQASACRVCESLESSVLPCVEQWIGRVTDLDCDSRLSIVMTDLDRRKSPGDCPVLGCVRRRDFSGGEQNSLSGDIVYLHHDLPDGDQLYALLAHELTHAAIYSISHEASEHSALKDHSVPSWLHEAAAHWVERQFCQHPAGYAIREAAFRGSPALSPIVLSDDDHMASRRTGSRAAGFTFLQQHLSSISDLRTLLQQKSPFDESIAAAVDESFERLFRRWSVNQTLSDSSTSSVNPQPVPPCPLQTIDSLPQRCRLHGTAFLVLRSDAEQSICIHADNSTRLQITVIPRRSATSLQTTAQSPGQHFKSADRTGPLTKRLY